MAPRARRAAIALTGCLLALGPTALASARPASPIAPSSPQAGTAGACRDAKGITVVVDASAFGDGVKVRCAPQPVRSGFDALTKAGFSYQGTTQYPGLLCRIDGEPASDPCHSAPPADAYWAYWHAPRGGDWVYSTSGAGTRVPPAGSVEGWAFGDDAEPTIDPPPPVATTTTTTTAPHPVTTAPAGGSTDTSVAPAAGGTSSTSVDGPASSSSTMTSIGDTTTTSLGAAAAASDEDGSDDQASAVQAPETTDSGSPAGAVAGLVGVVVIGGGALAIARRRRAAEGEPA
jgi:hypothetical protein